ncbi:hypothetical protein FAGAP_4629 [Fusarium agapanthi]|uniref:Uncharacterized protein n=1 Tax=Fusarium agapanthi TaxID=1803897 RepID=A0A9P5BD53_9HYPO|nr:hypothetical protein FAGAP_4629 [Fusarium agapanthi]
MLASLPPEILENICDRYTKELHFDPGVDADPKRCIHASDWLGYMANWTDWNYTSCIHSEILSLKHPSIKSLSFVTDPFCSRFNRWSRTSDINLSAFRKLRQLSLKAPMGCHFDDIASLVKANARQLEELELELQGWSPDRENLESTTIHHEDIPEAWNDIPASTMLARQMCGLEVATSEAAE